MAPCARIHYFDSNKKEHYQSVSKKDYPDVGLLLA